MANGNGYEMIRVSGLRKSFGTQIVLNGIDLAVQRGETLVILGRSGTGKSVLLKILVGLQKPDAGSVKIEGTEISTLSLNGLNEVRKKIGFLFQYSALFDSLTVEENVAFPLRRHRNLPEEELRSQVRDLLSQVGVERAASKLPSQISGGMRKRVALARALALHPEILLCDEPTAGLDPITSAEIDDLIRTLQRGHETTSVVVTHDLESARTIADRVALLHRGDLLYEGSFEGLTTTENQFVREFVRPLLHEGVV
jgi:phospholipid/cholesterol/gamma-HCH transport system ATP-binding protein